MSFKLGDKVLFDLFNGDNESTRRLRLFIGLVVNDNKNGTYDIIYIRGHNEIKTVKNIIERFIIPIEFLQTEYEKAIKIYSNLIEVEEKSFVTHKRTKELKVIRDSILNEITNDNVKKKLEKLEKYFVEESEDII